MTALDDRYGRTPTRRRVGRIIAVLAAIAVVVVMVLWVVWAGLFQPGASIETDSTRFAAADDRTATITGEVSVDPGKALSCAFAAQDEKQAIVGWKVVALPPSADRTRTITQTVRTVAQAQAGLIYACWLT